jgi:hypothetical protein
MLAIVCPNNCFCFLSMLGSGHVVSYRVSSISILDLLISKGSLFMMMMLATSTIFWRDF